MKILRLNHPVTVALLVAAACLYPNNRPCLAQVDATKSVPATVPVEQHLSYTPGIRDILKMLDAKVDVEVVKAYIKTSSIAFNPTASDIIALKKRDVPDDVISALMQRGAEVRAQLAQAAAQGNALQTAPAVPPQTYPYDYGATSPYYPYSAYSDYFSGYPYDYPYYGYPYNYWWYNSYPWIAYSPFFFGFRGHRFGDFDDRFHRFDRFRGGRSFAFQGRAGFAGRAAWAPAGGGFARRGFVSPGFGGRSFASGGVRTGGFAARMGGGGFAGRSGGGFGGHGGGHR